ncbi:AfsR/SARP family transcriptional regulator [Micromonospora sp. R77]|uniref:AfsR/SARP family transcriptional regulator n=1 Tax=Micromonospora sp. R77 TaxID=2925836 RepID=UPI001F624EE3|nr:AfsR/SARP family transcriptional regulator [Micromonospora sp. R77]MCI4063316.1 AfsR/SARP family transcriptional regulator [Micromonospora sp. R77]
MGGPREHGRLLGGVGWEVAGTPLPISGRQRRLLLGLLMLHAPAVVPVSRIATALWPGRDPADARPAVHVQLHRLRRALPALDLPGGRIPADQSGYALRLDGLDLDVLVFRQHHHDALRMVDEGRPDLALNLLREALGRWTGHPLGSLHPQASGWPEVAALEDARERARETLVDLEIALGRPAAALPVLRKAVAEHPEHEGFQRRLVQALTECGRHEEAVDAYRAYRSRRGAIPGGEPGPAPWSPRRTYQGRTPAPAVRPTPSAPADPHPAARHALLRAADFAERTGGHGQAQECLAAVLATTAPDEPERPRLLVRLADQRARDSGEGVSEAREALRIFTHRGDLAGIAEARLLLARIAWCRSDRRAALDAVAPARQVLAARPQVTWPVPLVASLVGLLAVTGQPDEAVGRADAALRSGERTPAPRDRSRLLSNRGIARLDLGDPGGSGDCLDAMTSHERSAGWTPVVLSVNAMDAVAGLGDLARYARILARARATAETRGCTQDLRYLDAARAWCTFWSGDPADAERQVQHWLAHEDRHFLTDQCLYLDGRLKLLRGNRSGAAQALERLTEQSRRGVRWQARVYAAVLAAALATGRNRPTRGVPALVEEAIGVVGTAFLPPELGVDLPILMRIAGVPATALARVAPSPWRSAAEAYLSGNRHQAAQRYRVIGSRTDLAGCRRRVELPPRTAAARRSSH